MKLNYVFLIIGNIWVASGINMEVPLFRIIAMVVGLGHLIASIWFSFKQ